MRLETVGGVTLIRGDALECLREFPDKSIHCCVTSPPYWGLRDYGTAKWEGGDENHEHDRILARGGRGGSGAPGKQIEGAFPSDLPAAICSCGARRIDSQLGLESTPQEYVEKMVAVFREVHRILRDDGTLWINLGDSYATNHSYQANSTKGGKKHGHAQSVEGKGSSVPLGLKPKDLVGIPWRVAFALQADGWYLRQDIIWAKPNPMPESVRDRCTKAHEYIFLLSKSEKYYFDSKAIQEPAINSGKTISLGPQSFSKRQADGAGVAASGNGLATEYLVPPTRNKRSVWTVTTKPFKGSHFATFPPGLIEPCILAGCPPNGFVLDPFAGSGTTGLVAQRHGRQAMLLELNPAYVDMAVARIKAG